MIFLAANSTEEITADVIRERTPEIVNRDLFYHTEYEARLIVNELVELVAPDTPSRRFQPFPKREGFRHIRFHDLRHSCASMLYANGVALKDIQEWLGHSDMSAASNIYTHLDYSAKVESANAILGLLE